MTYRSELRAAKKRDTRNALIDAAVRLFFEHGTEGPSLDAICEEAGCTRGAFYVHFKTREELIIAAMEHSLGEFLKQIMATNADSDAGFVDAFLDAIGARAALWVDAFSFGADGNYYVVTNQLHLSAPLNGGKNASKPPFQIWKFKPLAPGRVGR